MSLRNFSRKILNHFSAPHYYKGGSEQNKSGKLQLDRVLKLKKEWENSPEYSNPKYKEEEAIIDRDGLLLIPDFFSNEVFQKIKQEITFFKSTAHLKKFSNKDGFGVDWETGYPPTGLCPTLDNNLRNNELVLELVKHVTRRDIQHLPEVGYQKLFLPTGESDNSDVNRINHADRFYPTIKVVLLLEDVSSDQGPFMYCKGTHLLDARRLKFEEKVAYYNALAKEGRISEIPNKWIKNGRIVPPPELYSDQTGTPIVGKANTLAIINTCGFHYRGELKPNKSRECLRLIFHYVYSPKIAQDTLNLLQFPPSRYLN